MQKAIGIIDFGGQYAHLISSRIRRLGAYTEILSNDESIDRYKNFSALILSGGPASVYEEDSPKIDETIFSLGIPILGICYGLQLTVKVLGGVVSKANTREYGKAILNITESSPFLNQLNITETVWMSHGDEVSKLPDGFQKIASSVDCEYAAIANEEKKIYGIQFHPEVLHTLNGNKFLLNFIKISGLENSWSIKNFLEDKMLEIKTRVPSGKKVFMLVSGGVDSSVAYVLLSRVLGKENVRGLLVDTGFMRKNEIQNLKKNLNELGFSLTIADSANEFYDALKNSFEPEEKRKIIGELFLKIQERMTKEIISDPENWILGQGTIYPDTIESGGTKHASKIKTHHNRVDTILELLKEGKVIEPLHELYKDEVRELGKMLGLDSNMIERHPFPGPGLAVRMITSSEDNSFHNIHELDKFKSEYKKLNLITLPIRSVGVQGDSRTYSHPAIVNDFTKDWETLEELSTKITNSVNGVNRVIFLPFKKKVPKKIVFNQIYLDRVHSDILRESDHIVTKILQKYKIEKEIWQMPVALLPIGKKKNEFSIVLRPVESTEAMTANFYKMKRKILKKIVNKISKQKEISFVFYDITNKPPGTIEWE
ncbi:MAG: glutamine-hydrolyzing GMP synthase [Leptospiraceae bacterium]|nr:glutamine-hydrolyzing GMP synthase [Leptospiraceae bacterium]